MKLFFDASFNLCFINQPYANKAEEDKKRYEKEKAAMEVSCSNVICL